MVVCCRGSDQRIEAVKSLYAEEICKPCQKTRIMGS